MEALISFSIKAHTDDWGTDVIDYLNDEIIALRKELTAAIDKIEEGVYGECEGCGEEIGLKRLEARPVAELCIDCKAEQEKLERGMG